MAESFCPHCMRSLPGGASVCPDCKGRTRVQALPHQMPIGTVLKSRNGHSFVFGEVKGEGGFGLTYIAKELATGRVVAIKEYFPTRCQPQRLADGAVRPVSQMAENYQHGMRSFLSEASMLHAVDSIPSIVQVLDYFEAGGTAYMVMEYLQGETLSHRMAREGRMEPRVLFGKVLPLMQDMACLHDAGVLHRDIAPDNIMWMPDGTLKLLDFGCARSLEDGRSMTVVLKPGFAPIEQYQTRGQGPYTDVYALCATLYYCLTGQVPPASPDRLSAVFDNQPDPLVPPTALGVKLSAEQEQVLLWGLALQPTVRPQRIGDMASRLEAAPYPVEETPRRQTIEEPKIHTTRPTGGSENDTENRTVITEPQPQPSPQPGPKPEPKPDPLPPAPAPAPQGWQALVQQHGGALLLGAAAVIIVLLVLLLFR